MRSILKVITPATCQDLTVLATAKGHLGIAALDTSKDVAVQTLIKRASDVIANHCGRVFGLEAVKETVFLDVAFESLPLRRYPVKDSPAPVVKVDGVILVADSDYIFDGGHGLFYRVISGAVSQWTGDTVEVTYSGGYNLLPELPFALEQACLSMIALYYSTGTRDPLAKRIEIPGVQTVDYWVGPMSGDMNALPPDVERHIAPFRDYRIG